MRTHATSRTAPPVPGIGTSCPLGNDPARVGGSGNQPKARLNTGVGGSRWPRPRVQGRTRGLTQSADARWRDRLLPDDR